MLINESKWIGEQIKQLPLKKDHVVLNFGSQTLKYNQENRYIIDFVINPLKQKCQLKNLDLHNGAGIDYSGDILNDTFFSHLASIQFDCILLCNVLEHVTDIDGIAQRVGELIKSGGFLIFSGPYKYPIHFDPIDNNFRPTVEDINRLFNNFKTIQSATIDDHTYSYYLKKDMRFLFISLLRLLMPFYRYNKWKRVMIPKLKWWNKRYKVTCVLMQKEF
jgi:SAM-dependent methyltransferase